MPQCATCEEYISSDFARVLGDNNGVVRACLSCHGKGAEVEQTTEPAVETASPDVSETLDESDELEVPAETGVKLDEVAAASSQVVVASDDAYRVQRPGAEENPGEHRSRFEFIRSIFSD